VTTRTRDETGVLLAELWAAARVEIARGLAELELTPIQAHVLRLLDPDRPLAMSEIADALVCDASNVTGLVDRLEARRLVERRGSASDRRVKELVVTDAGRRVRREAIRILTRPPAAIRALPEPDRTAFEEILRRALGRPDRI
jgi:DNA-binding MarR family transcriptional regulator